QYDTLIFISNSMGNAALNEALALASNHPDTALVMRGIPDGTNIMQGVLHIQQMAVQFDPVPNVILEPSLFSKYNIDAVPTIVALEQTNTSNALPDDVKSQLENLPIPNAESVELPRVIERHEIARVQGLF